MAEILLNNGVTPNTPAAGYLAVYSKTADKLLYTKDEFGNEYLLNSVRTFGLVTVVSAATPDIFGAAGATISLDNSTPVTATSFAACTVAQVGLTKTVTPNTNWNITASASLKVDGATSGTFVMPLGARLSVLATSTTTFELITIFATGTWTPNQGPGLTLVGAFSSSGSWTKVGRNVTLIAHYAGATSVAVSSAGQISTNCPITSGQVGGGILVVGNGNDSCGVSIAGVTIYSMKAIAAQPSIDVIATYLV
jgi:hypothetical protein